MNDSMNDYNRFCDEQVNQQNYFGEDFEMSPNTEQNPNPHMQLDPPNDQIPINLSEQNPDINPSSLMNQSQNKENQVQNEINMDQTEIDQYHYPADNDIHHIDLLFPYYDGDDKIENFSELSNVEVNKTMASYQNTENQASEVTETNMQNHPQIIKLYENTAEETKKKDS